MRVVFDSILYFFGVGSNPLSFDVKDDTESIRSDWEKVGSDIRKAITLYEAEIR